MTVLGGACTANEVRFGMSDIQHKGSVPAVSVLASFADLQIFDGIAASMPSSTCRSTKKTSILNQVYHGIAAAMPVEIRW